MRTTKPQINFINWYHQLNIMKTILLTVISFAFGALLEAAYYPSAFLFPKMHHSITLKNSKGQKLEVEHSYVYNEGQELLHSMRFRGNASQAILASRNALTFIFSVSGSNTTLKRYETELSSGFVSKKEISQSTWLKFPEEAWGTEESKFAKSSGTNLKYSLKGSYKKIRAKNGKEYFCYLAKVYSYGTKIYTLAFAKDIGLLQYITSSGEVYENDLWFENLAQKLKGKYSSESTMRKESWKYYKRVTAIRKDTTGRTVYNSPRNQKFRRSFDTLSAVYLGLYYKNSSMSKFGSYLLSSQIVQYLSGAFNENDKKNRNDEMGFYAEWALYLTPKHNRSDINSLKKHITKVDQNYSLRYTRILERNIQYIGMKSFYRGLSKYECQKMLNLAEVFEKVGSKDPENRENVFNYVAFAHQRLGNSDEDLKYNAMAAMEFAKFSDDLKAENIRYAKSIIKDLVNKTTSDEKIHVQAIDALIAMKAKNEALEKARQGFEKGFDSKEFAFAYADIGLERSKKMDVVKAVELIENHLENLTVQEKTKLVKFYRFIGENAKADAIEKARQKQADEIAKAKAKEERKKRRRKYGGGVGLAVSTNPANLLWNTFPIAADVRFGKAVHQLRLNTHTDRSSSSLFGNYSLGYDLNDRKEWTITKGRDYSYSLLYPLGDGMFAGIQGFYGQLNMRGDTVVGTRLSDRQVGSVQLSPQVTRYGGAFQFGYRIASRKQHYYFAFYYLIGAGYRTMDYGYTGATDISDPAIFEFRDDVESYGYRHDNWNKVYGIFNLRMRVGITLF